MHIYYRFLFFQIKNRQHIYLEEYANLVALINLIFETIQEMG